MDKFRRDRLQWDSKKVPLVKEIVNFRIFSKARELVLSLLNLRVTVKFTNVILRPLPLFFLVATSHAALVFSLPDSVSGYTYIHK